MMETTSMPRRAASDPLPSRSKFTFRGVAHTIMKVLALEKRGPDT
jgi:hypothetical protein